MNEWSEVRRLVELAYFVQWKLGGDVHGYRNGGSWAQHEGLQSLIDAVSLTVHDTAAELNISTDRDES